MAPTLENLQNKKDTTTFTIKDINVSLANAIRRIILSEIPIIVIRSAPHARNDVMIEENTTRFNNEILKQRLSCIPIHIRDNLTLEELAEYQVEVDQVNDTSTIQMITTEHFKIKHKSKYLSDAIVHQIFPPDPFTKDYVLFARLRPKLSEELPGERLKLKATLSRGMAKESSMFNVVSTCSYAMTPDEVKQNAEWDTRERELEKNLSESEIRLKKKNWMLSEGKRIYLPNSFDFIIETLGIYKNNAIIKIAIEILKNKLDNIQILIDEETLDIKKSVSTVNYSFDIILPNEDYTIGKVLENLLYEDHYKGDNTLSYLGFIKKHPHDTFGLLRMAFKEEVDKSAPKEYLRESITKAKEIYTSLEAQF